MKRRGEKSPPQLSLYYQNLNPLAPGGPRWIISINGMVKGNNTSAKITSMHHGQFSNTFGGFASLLFTSAIVYSVSPLGAKNAKLMKIIIMTIIPTNKIDPPTA